MTSMEPIKLKPFDQYVAEAQRPPLELPLPDGTSIVIPFPTGRSTRAYAAALKTGDPIAMIVALLPAPEAQRLLAFYDDAPGSVLGKLVGEMETAWQLDEAARVPGGSTA